MKTNYNLFLRNPQSQTEDEKNAFSDIGRKINERLQEISELKNFSNDLYVTIFFERKQIPDGFASLGNRLYLKDNTSLRSLGWAAFMPTVKASLSKIQLPLSVKNIAVVFSLSLVSETDIFAINNEEDKSTVSYVAQEPIVTLDDVVMNDDERKALLRALTIITERDLIFNKWGFNKIDKSTKSVLCFHGAAGTGKTMCAHGVAHYLGKKILIGSYSQIQSKFVGEGEKNLVTYFKSAAEQDAVLFIDEADTFLSKRLPSSNENSKHYNSMSNELYQLIEDFNGCIVFASNHIQDFDPAVISRIIEPIEFKLPDKSTRKKIIQKLLPPAAPIILSDDEMAKLASLTDGFSGRDIRKAMLLFVADSAYSHHVLGNENPNDIKLTFQEIESAFKSVKKAKDNLNKRVNGFSIASRVSEETKKNTRLLQIAAHTLWVDDVIDEREKKLFNELSTQLGTSIDINDKDSFPTVDKICEVVIDKKEKVQLLDVACRMAAIDGMYPKNEETFLHNLATILGFNADAIDKLNEYVDHLIMEGEQWTSITSYLRDTEHNIFRGLCKEFSEPSAWNKLGTSYLRGDKLEGVCLPVNLDRARICFNRAIELGYQVSKETQEFLANK